MKDFAIRILTVVALVAALGTWSTGLKAAHDGQFVVDRVAVAALDLEHSPDLQSLTAGMTTSAEVCAEQTALGHDANKLLNVLAGSELACFAHCSLGYCMGQCPPGPTHQSCMAQCTTVWNCCNVQQPK